MAKSVFSRIFGQPNRRNIWHNCHNYIESFYSLNLQLIFLSKDLFGTLRQELKQFDILIMETDHFRTKEESKSPSKWMAIWQAGKSIAKYSGQSSTKSTKPNLDSAPEVDSFYVLARQGR